MTLECDPQRLNEKDNLQTGIFVRAKDPTDGKWISADIAWLTMPSLQEWLKSRGGDNKWAESTVCILLGHKL